MHEFRRGSFVISTDKSRLDPDLTDRTLARMYWSENVPRPVVETAIENSLCYGLYDGDRQVGFTRVVTDFSSFACLCGVFVLEEYRGRKLGVWLIECVMSHPMMPHLRRILLATRDAHELYRRFGFHEPENPRRIMEIWRPGLYRHWKADAEV
jgi:GNAT superfamily N-acetyltransferase